MKHKCLHHCCCWDGEFSKETFHPSLKSSLCLGLGEWSFPRYKAHACCSSVILYDPGAYQQFDLESQLSSSFAFHLIICGSCFAILLWYEEDGCNALLIVRGKMFSGFSEETTFCMIVISTKGLWYVKTLKTFQDSNADWEEGLPKMEETTCGVLWRCQTSNAIRDPCRTCWNTNPATPPSEFLIQSFWGEALTFAFLTHCQGLLLLLSQVTLWEPEHGGAHSDFEPEHGGAHSDFEPGVHPF